MKLNYKVKFTKPRNDYPIPVISLQAQVAFFLQQLSASDRLRRLREETSLQTLAVDPLFGIPLTSQPLREGD
jgi:hypothetical protein